MECLKEGVPAKRPKTAASSPVDLALEEPCSTGQQRAGMLMSNLIEQVDVSMRTT